MPDRFEELFEEARGSGKVSEDWLEKFQSTFEASPLRQEIKTTKERNREIMEQNKSLRSGLLRDRFSKFGITISPDILNIPDDLDPTNEEGVQDWATKMGLLKEEPTTPEADRAVHDRIATASNEGGDTTPSIADLDPTKLSEDEFWSRAQALEESQRK